MQRRSFSRGYFRQHQHLRFPRWFLFWPRTEFLRPLRLSPSFKSSATNSWKVGRRAVICCEGGNPSSLHLTEERPNPRHEGYTPIKLPPSPPGRASDGDLGASADLVGPSPERCTRWWKVVPTSDALSPTFTHA